MDANHLILFAVSSTWLSPLWIVGAGVAVAVAALFAMGAVLRLLAPKVRAAHRQCYCQEALSQPLFYVLLASAFSA